jgi:transglutaminase-like putative cysteine protease
MKIILSKFLFLLLTILCFGWYLPATVSAANNFTTDYNVTYSPSEDGTTHALLNVTLTNTSSQYYASLYKVQLGFDKITNVKASDPDGPINPILSKTDEGYIIELKFNKKSVGMGSKLTFTLSFDTPNVAKQYGKIWEINIPGIANPDEFQSFTVHVDTPPTFGHAAYIKPAQASNNLTFTKDQLGKAGISVAVGDQQVYIFHLVYHLKNNNVFPIKTEIALPPSTNYQDVFIQNISPRPDNVVIDKDGNWLAQFSLLPSQQLDVTADGKAQVILTPKQVELSPQEIAEYTKPQKHWESGDDAIKELADTLKTPQAIYQYVVKTLKYDFSRVTESKPRLGALGALKNQNSAVCLEFTDLFIALARAAGIPAREINGYAYTENSRQRPLSLVKDILHAWPEYYDQNKKTWVMIDPTWGSTTGGVDYFNTLDFDHFAFVVKGRDSEYPIPAGGYKLLSDKNAKDVNVDFGESIIQQTPAFEVKSNVPDFVMSALPIAGNVTVMNNGQGLVPAQIMYLDTTSLSPQNQTVAVDPIPPFGWTNVPVRFNPPSFLTNSKRQFTIRLADKTATQTVDISPLLMRKWGIIGIGGGIIIGILTIIIFIITRKSRRV